MLWNSYFALACLLVVVFWLRGKQNRFTNVFVPLACIAWTYGISLTASVVLSQNMGTPLRRLHPVLIMSSAVVPVLVLALARTAWLRHASLVVSLFVLLLVEADALHIRYFGSILSFAEAGNAGQLWAVRESILELLEIDDLHYVGLGLLSVMFWWASGPSQTVAADTARARRHRRLVRIPVVTVLLLGLWPVTDNLTTWMQEQEGWKIFRTDWAAGSRGIFFAHAREVLRQRLESQAVETPTAEALQRTRDYARLRDRQRSAYTDEWGVFRGSNFIAVQVEALQEWVVDVSLHGELVMPFLHELANTGRRFDHVYDQTGDSLTSDCEYLFLNSLHPLPRGAVAFRRTANDFVTVPEVFRANGYTTYSAHGYDRGMWNRGILHPKYGFDQSDFRAELGSEPSLGWGLSDEAFFRRVGDRLSRLPQPFFAFLITLTSHHPYRAIPVERHQLDTSGIPKATLVGYLESMRYVDGALAKFFEVLDENGLRENTAIVIFGDHDSRMLINKRTTQAMLQRTDLAKREAILIGLRAFATKRIPLFIVPPTSREKAYPVRRVHTAAGQIDFGPTLLHLAGLRTPASMLGAPIPSSAADRWVARFDGAAANGYATYDPDGQVECVSVRDLAPLARENCAGLRAAPAVQLESSLIITMNDLAHELAETDGSQPVEANAATGQAP